MAAAVVAVQQLATAFAELAELDSQSERASVNARILMENGHARLFLAWQLEQCRDQIVEIANRCFWKALDPLAACTNASRICDILYVAIDESYRNLLVLRQRIEQYHELFSKTAAIDAAQDIAEFQRMSRTIVFSSRPEWFSSFVIKFFTFQFQLWDRLTAGEAEGNSTPIQLQQFHSHICPQLKALGWLPIFEFGFTTALMNQVQENVHGYCSGRFESPALPSLMEWFEKSVQLWTTTFIPSDDCTKYMSRMRHFLYESIGELRIQEMFDIIVDFPDSLGAVTDLSECLAHTDQRPILIKSLNSAFEKRLLHAGAMTKDIVIQHIACFRVMRILDPSGLILHNIIDPIASYLRTRADAIKVVVTALIDDSEPYGLLSELERPVDSSEQSLYADFSADNNNFDEDEGEDWQPEPMQSFGEMVETAQPGSSWWLRRSGNVLTQLVHIFGNTDQLIEEYRHVLAARLMRCVDYNTDKEVHHLELLKQRFGDAKFRSADVMVADIAMSKRIDANIRRTINRPHFPLSCMIISKELWPSFNDTDGDVALVLPDAIRSFMVEYNKQYEILKAPRELNFKPNFGSADLTLSFQDGRHLIISDVSPIHATILFAFSDLEPNQKLSLLEISDKTQIPSSLVQRKLEFWISKGVLFVPDPGNYSVVEFVNQSVPTSSHLVYCNDSDEDGENAFSAESQQRESAKMLEAYILGILPSSFGGFTLQRIDAILRTAFVSGSSYYCRTESELHDILDMLVREGKLECVDGVYKQPAKPSR